MSEVRTGYSYIEYEGDGVTDTYSVNFVLGYLRPAFVTCQVNNEEDGIGNPIYRALTFLPGDTGMVQIGGAVPGVGESIVFRRVIPKDLLMHMYSNGSILDYPSLDESHLQLMMALQEVLDGFGLANIYTDIDMHGFKIVGVLSDSAIPNSVVTFEELQKFSADVQALTVLGTPEGSSFVGFLQDGTGADARTVQDKLRDVVSVKDFGETQNVSPKTIESIKTSDAIALDVLADFTISVGHSGDFSNINDAIASAIRMRYSSFNAGTTKIRLLSGFLMQEQVFVKGEDLSWIEIYGDDAVTNIDSAYITESFVEDQGGQTYVGANGLAVFAVSNGSLPVINQKFDLQQTGVVASRKTGVLAMNGGRVLILPGNGFVNCGDVGGYAKSGGHITARHCDFSGCRIGLYAFESSTIDADSAICNNCDLYGIYVNRCSTVNHQYGEARNNRGDNIRVIRCSLYNGYMADLSLTSPDAPLVPPNNRIFKAGIYALNSTVCAWAASLDDCVGPAVFAEQASIVSIRGASAKRCGGEATVYASSSSSIDASEADVSDSVNTFASVYAIKGATIDFTRGKADRCSGGSATIWAFSGATISADLASAVESAHSIAVVYAQRSSNVSFQSGVGSNRTTATYGLRCSELSRINGRSASVQKSGVNSNTDCSVALGGMIAFHGGLGGVSAEVLKVFNGDLGTVYAT